LALQVALAKLLDSAVKPGAQGPAPLLGTLQKLGAARRLGWGVSSVKHQLQDKIIPK